MDMPYEEEQFDCVIFGDVLEHLFDPWAVIEKVKPYIKQNGVILASIPNVSHISVLALTCWKLDVYRIWFIR